MIMREFLASDENEVVNLWRKHNRNDVYLPDLIYDCKVTNKLVIEDENGKIIAFTCFNLIPEIILIHDKSVPMRLRRKALHMVFEAVKFFGLKHNFIQLYCFLDTFNWIKHLTRLGFKRYDKGMYYLDIGE